MAENNHSYDAPQRNSQARGGRRAQREDYAGKQPRKKRSTVATVFLRIFQVLGTLLLIGIVTGAFLACYAAVYIKTAVLPNATLDLDAYTLNENSVIYYYDDNGQARELTTLVGSQNQEWVDYEDIPEDLINAVVAIEDHRFWDHNGVDWYRTAGAFVNMFLGMRNTFGGSTLTQQLIKNLTQYDDVTVTRKISEIFTALYVEDHYEKDEILELYLNVIYLGNSCYGVQAASEFYFGKPVSELTLAECASLAGITNNPSLYSPNAQLNVTRYPCLECGTYSLSNDEPCSYCGAENYGPAEIWNGRDYNKARQELILGEMLDADGSNGYSTITQAEYDAAVAETLVFTWDDAYTGDVQFNEDGTPVVEEEDSGNVNSWYVDAVISELIDYFMEEEGMAERAATQLVYSGGLRIYTPFDPDAQASVDQIFENWDASRYISSTGQELSSAITIVDNTTGYVVAMSGDLGEKEVNRGWNNALATRQPGSSFKPLSVYAPGLEMGLITPATVLDDAPVRILNGQVWPLNLPRGYSGLYTVLQGVIESKNTIATRVLELVTPEESFRFLEERFGITTLEEGYYNSAGEWKTDYDYSPLAMGGLTRGVTTFEMAAAFATFPRNGTYTEPTTFLLVEDMDGNVVVDHTPQTNGEAIKDTTAYYINSMLTSAVTSGTGTGARISGQLVAGKTGTSDNSYNFWFAGYTAHYTAAVWSGYPQYDEIVNDQWGNPSVYLWREVMTLVHQGLERREFPTLDHLRAYTVCMDCGNLATEDCQNDSRGNRSQTFYLAAGDGPTEYCVCHVPVEICLDCPILDANGEETGAYKLAGEHCPEESVRTITMVDYEREVVSDSVTIGDEYALISIYETLFPNEEDRYCDTHDGQPYDPSTFDINDPETWPTEEEWPGFDPEDETTWPNYEPPVEPSEPPVEPSDPPVESSPPVEPTPEVPPDSGGTD